MMNNTRQIPGWTQKTQRPAVMRGAPKRARGRQEVVRTMIPSNKDHATIGDTHPTEAQRKQEGRLPRGGDVWTKPCVECPFSRRRRHTEFKAGL